MRNGSKRIPVLFDEFRPDDTASLLSQLGQLQAHTANQHLVRDLEEDGFITKIMEIVTSVLGAQVLSTYML